MKAPILIIAIAVSLFANSAIGQQKSQPREDLNPQEMAEKKVSKMDEKLNLSEEQNEKLTAIFYESAVRMEAVKAKYPELKDAKNEMKAVKQSSKQDLKKILSEDQLKKMHQLRTENKKQGMQNREEGEKPDLSKLQKQLDLSTSQMNELENLKNSKTMEMEAIKAKYPNLENAKKETKQIKNETREQVRNVLTLEQKQQLKELKGNHSRKH